MRHNRADLIERYEQNKYLQQVNNLHKEIIYLTRSWTTADEISARKDRDWKAFDRLTEIEKLTHRISEAKKYNLESRLDTISTTGSQERSRND